MTKGIRHSFLVLVLSATCLSSYGQRFVKVFDTMAALQAANPSDVHTNAFVVGYRTPNDGGGGTFTYVASSSTTVVQGMIVKPTSFNGRWLREFSGPVNAKWLGAFGDNATDDTSYLQAGINYVASIKGTLFIPSGTYLHQGLVVYGAMTIQGNGSGRDSTTNSSPTVLKYTASGVAIQKATATPIYDFGLRDIQLLGTDGNGGTGLLLDSFQYFKGHNVNIGKFRNAAGSGRGLARLCTDGVCAFNFFDGFQIEDSDTASYSDSTTVHSVGYSTFIALTVYQQGTVIDARNTAGNGSINDVYVSLQIQGDNTTTNDYIYMQGRDNKFYGITIDAPGSGYWINEDQANASGNEYYWNSAPDENQFRSIQTIGKRAIVGGAGLWSYSFGRTFQMFQPGGATELSLLSDDDQAVELHFGNGEAGSQAWRWTMDSGTNTPSLRLRNTSGGGLTPMTVAYEDGSIEYSGSATYRNSKNIYMIDTNGVSHRVLGSTDVDNVQVFGFPTGTLQVGTPHEDGQVVLTLSNTVSGFFDKTGLTLYSNLFVGVGGNRAGYITIQSTNGTWSYFVTVDNDGKFSVDFGEPDGSFTNALKLSPDSGFGGTGTKVLTDASTGQQYKTAANAGLVTAATNVGGGPIGIYNSTSGGLIQFNTIQSGGNLTISSNAGIITFTPLATVNAGANIGAGTGVYAGSAGNTLNFFSLIGTNGTTVSSNGNVVVIDGGGGTGGGSGYNRIQEEGSNLTQRTNLNFIGGGVTAVDNGGSLRTDVTITRSGIIRELWVPADLFVTNGATFPATYAIYTYGNPADWNHKVISYGDSATEGATFTLSLPSTWNLGTIKAKIYWTANTGTATQGVSWRFASYSATDGENILALSTKSTGDVDLTDTYLGADLVHISSAASLTYTNTPTTGELQSFRLLRVPSDGGDTKTGPALLLGVKVQYTESSTEPSSW